MTSGLHLLSQDVLDRLPEKIRSLVRLRPSGCWQWLGKFRKHDGRPVFRKKYAYHCDDKTCVNPWHVVAITQSEHMKEHGFGGDQRVGQAKKTRCKNGHPYDQKNTIIVKTKSGNERQCRICRNVNRRRHYLKTKGIA
jgi:hypothetical protein